MFLQNTDKPTFDAAAAGAGLVLGTDFQSAVAGPANSGATFVIVLTVNGLNFILRTRRELPPVQDLLALACFYLSRIAALP